MLAIHFKRLWKNPVTLCMTIFILAVVIVPMYIVGVEGIVKITDESSLPLRGMVTIIPYLFFGFLFLSYEMFYGWNKSQIQETIVGGTKNKIWDKGSCALLIIFINLIACILTFGVCLKNCYDLGMQSMALYTYEIREIFIYQFLCCMMAVVIGWEASHILKRIWGITAILIVAYLFDGGFIQTLMCLDLKNYSIWKFALLFCSYMSDVSAMEPAHYCLTAENVNIFRNLFWIFFFISVGLVIGKRKKLYAAASSIITVVLLVLYIQPSGAVYIIPGSDGFDSWSYPYMYYGEYGWKREVDFEKYMAESRDDFTIKEYDIRLKVDDILSAKVSVTPDNKALSEYQFTLYHKYKIDKVTDGKGQSLKFKQESDYTTVYSPSGKTDKIIFEYSGYEQWYYATTQGMFLAANFPYYPKAGWNRVFLDSKTAKTFRRSRRFWSELPKEKAAFKVDLMTKGNWQVYSNIGKNGESVRNGGYSHYEFKGETDGVTLIGNPYLREKYISGVRVIYSEIDNFCGPLGDKERDFENSFAKLEGEGCSLRGKTFFVYYIDQYNSEFMGKDQCLDSNNFIETVRNYEKYGTIYEKISDEELRKEQEEMNEFIKQEELFREEEENE